MIHEVIARIVWWVDINHFDLAHIGVLEQFSALRDCRLRYSVLGGVPIDATDLQKQCHLRAFHIEMHEIAEL